MVKSSPGKPEKSREIPNRGLPLPDRNHLFGNLIIRFAVNKPYKKQDPPVEHELFVTMEELSEGCTKRMKITRSRIDENNHLKDVTKIVTINIEPGTEIGKKFIFPKEGDYNPNAVSADIVFIIKNKPHSHILP